MFFNGHFVKLSIHVLVSGMKIDGEVFYKNKDNYILLCRDTVLTDKLIHVFCKIALNNDIYVSKEMVPGMLTQSAALKGLTNEAHSFPGYEEVKSDAKHLLNQIGTDQSVPMEVTNSITETLQTKLDTVDVSSIIQSINSIRMIDEYLYTHSVNVALLNGLISKWLKLDEHSTQELLKAGLLHDIGKLCVSPGILNKPGKLTREEFDIMKRHPLHSFDLLTRSGVRDAHVLKGILQHHEKVNGMGYPYGLDLSSITEFGRITAISDVYDAMVAKRVYKDAHSPFEILSWFAEGRYSDLDIFYVNIFIYCMREELTGKSILLSDGSIGQVVHIFPDKLQYPLVRVEDEVISTSPALSCVSVCDSL